MNNETVKIFICQPMSGREESVVKMERRFVMKDLKRIAPDMNFEYIDNWTHPDAPKDASRLWHLGESIKQLADADYIVFVPGWYKAKGCCVEKVIQILYKIPVINIKKEMKQRKLK